MADFVGSESVRKICLFIMNFSFCLSTQNIRYGPNFRLDLYFLLVTPHLLLMLNTTLTGDCKSKLFVGHREAMPILRLKFDN